MKFLVWAFWESVFNKIAVAVANCDHQNSKLRRVAQSCRCGGLLSVGIASAAAQNRSQVMLWKFWWLLHLFGAYI